MELLVSVTSYVSSGTFRSPFMWKTHKNCVTFNTFFDIQKNDMLKKVLQLFTGIQKYKQIH